MGFKSLGGVRYGVPCSANILSDKWQLAAVMRYADSSNRGNLVDDG